MELYLNMLGVNAAWWTRSRYGRGMRSTRPGGTSMILRWVSWMTSWRRRRTPGQTAACVWGAGTAGSTVPGEGRPLVGATQATEHAPRAQGDSLLAPSLGWVAAGGLYAMGVNAVGTDVH